MTKIPIQLQKQPTAYLLRVSCVSIVQQGQHVGTKGLSSDEGRCYCWPQAQHPQPQKLGKPALA
jgi:hypothetical protein